MYHKTLFAFGLCLLAPLGRAQNFTERTKLQGSTTVAGDILGAGVATDGFRTVVGSWVLSGTGPGKAFVFEGCSGITETQALQASDGFPLDEFGFSVAIDGERIVIGARQSGLGPGAAYVFRFDGSQWIEEQKLSAPDGATNDIFGHAVDIDDDLIAVGAFNHDGGKGALYLYRFDGMQWVLEFQPARQALNSGAFGFSVSIDGDRVAVGAVNDTPPVGPPTRILVGAVEVFSKVGSTWNSEGVLLPTSADGLDQVGASVALQGNHLLIGSPGADSPLTDDNRGLLYAYEWNGTWQHTQTLLPSDAVAGDSVGNQVRMDGVDAVVSAQGSDSSALAAGCIYTYHHDGTQWVEVEKLVTSDAEAGDLLYSVSLSGGMLVTGVILDDDLGTNSGSVYVFASSFGSYGRGLAGTGSLTPSLNALGSATPGGTLSLQFRDFVGGAPACYVAGVAMANLPFRGGELLIDLTETNWMVSFATPGSSGVSGDGDLDFSVQVPAGPSFSCANVYVQGFAIDRAAPWNVSMTNGLRLFID